MKSSRSAPKLSTKLDGPVELRRSVSKALLKQAASARSSRRSQELEPEPVDERSMAERLQPALGGALLSPLRSDQLRVLAPYFAARTLAAGTSICNEGETGDFCVVILTGSLLSLIHI